MGGGKKNLNIVLTFSNNFFRKKEKNTNPIMRRRETDPTSNSIWEHI